MPVMIQKSVRLKTIVLVLVWSGSVAGAYWLGSRGADGTDAAAEAARAAQLRAPAGLAGGVGPGRATEKRVDPDGQATGDKAGEPSAAGGRMVDFTARMADIQAMPPGPERNEAMFDLMKEWAAADGPAALAAAGAVAEPKLRFELREAALRHWASADPDAAWKFASENPNGDLPDHRMQLVFDGLGRTDPAKALAFFDKHRAEMEKQGDRAAYVFDELYERGGHDQLVGWAEKMPPGKLRDMAANRIIDRWARYDPESAKQWMERTVTNKENLTAARIELAESWARVNPGAALQWANALPADQRDGEFYNRIYGRWLQYDRNTAASSLATQPPSPALDRPIERYTYEVMRQNPADTMPWAESINDAGRRWRAIERVADVWRTRDPAALQNYVMSNATLTEEQKRKLLKQETKK